MIFARSTEYPRSSSRNPLKQDRNNFRIKRRKPRRLSKKPGLRLLVSANNRKHLIKRNRK
jgi:hypothetical protein